MTARASPLLALLLAASRPLAAEPAAPAPAHDAAPVVVGTAMQLHSAVLGEDRTIKVALPDGYEAGGRYPVLYHVDAQWGFVLTVNAVRVLTANGLAPPMIVVGIDTERERMRDLLPVRVEHMSAGGGAPAFLRFVKEELVPFVERSWRTQPWRALAGASAGGVFGLFAFAEDPTYFDALLVVSPALRLGGGELLSRVEAALAAHPELRAALHVSLANEGPGMGVGPLVELLGKKAPAGLRHRYDEYLSELHGSVAYRATWDGLRFFFEGWRREGVAFETRGALLGKGSEVEVSIAPAPGWEVRYTTDGTEPTLASPRYQRPLRVDRPLTVRALPFLGRLPGAPGVLQVRAVPRLAASPRPPPLVPGLRFSYYEGHWDRLPDFGKLPALFTEDFPPRGPPPRAEDWGLRIFGWLDVAEPGLHTFYLTSDDGSRLTLGDRGEFVLDNDGLHGEREERAQVFLQKGKHRLQLDVFQAAGGFALRCQLQAEGGARRELFAEPVFHEK